jgi:DNA-binding MarR family transcriptional regulator
MIQVVPKREPKAAAKHRAALIERLNLAGRESSTATVMFHTAVAARRGLSMSEEKALDVLLREGPLTHAQLCHATGLAAPSVSDLIDRLQSKGYAVREPHPQDGRSVLVSVDAPRIYAEMAPLFANWVKSLDALYATYSDRELETIRDFLSKAAERQRSAAEGLSEL